MRHAVAIAGLAALLSNGAREMKLSGTLAKVKVD